MGFRGVFGPEGVVGSQTEVLETQLNAVGGDTKTVTLPAGKSRLRIYGVWISVGGFMEAHATTNTGLQFSVQVFENGGGFANLARVSLSVAAPAGEMAFDNVAVPAFAADRGVVIGEGFDLGLSFSVGKLPLAGPDPVDVHALQRTLLFIRAE